MKRNLKLSAITLMTLGLISCKQENVEYFSMVSIQENTAEVLWNPEEYDFETGNKSYIDRLSKLSEAANSAGACTSWRNGKYHGRNLDWYQADYGCIIIKMPKGGNVKHASVGLLNSSPTVTHQFIKDGVIDDNNKSILPCGVVDGINDAGVTININIVPHQPGAEYITEGDLSSQCVVRYVLDNAGSVDEAIELLEGRTVIQSIVAMAGDETHYMISDKEKTAVVEFDNGKMAVTYFDKNEKGYYSKNGNPAIMTNLYDFEVEEWGLGTDEFYENHPLAMGVERWASVRDQYDNAALSVEDNLEIATSVWYYKHFLAEKDLWYTDNAVPTAYGKDEKGWYYTVDGNRVDCDGHVSAQHGYWDGAMEKYRARYEKEYGQVDDPHVKGNDFWETSHTVVYDIDAKKGYLIPFENFYAKDKAQLEPIVITLPE
ncbi:MAG: linear amide C-N hydrolase [Bacteroidales bacterium]|nr:linear amide C-N hydrolase [Candidatus Cryptobacteroides caccocaballi]